MRRWVPLAARGGLTILASGLLVVGSALPAAAHEPIEEALAHGEGPPDWIYPVGAGLALLVSLCAAAVRAAQTLDLIDGPRLRHWAPLTHLLAAWVFLGLAQTMMARSGQPSAVFLMAGYFLLPAALAAVWIIVLVNFRSFLRRVFSRARYRWLAVLVAGGYAVLAAWSSNLVAPPAADEMPAPGTPAFVDLGWFHGPLAIWPAVEFWLPAPPIFGALSVGVVAVLATVAALMGLAWAAAVYAVQLGRGQRRNRPAGAGRLTGMAAAGTVGLNVCCCCAPAIFPVLALVFGPTAGASIATWFLGSSSPLYDVGLVAMIVATIVSLASLRRRLPVGAGPASPAAVEAGPRELVGR